MRSMFRPSGNLVRTVRVRSGGWDLPRRALASAPRSKRASTRSCTALELDTGRGGFTVVAESVAKIQNMAAISARIL